MNYRTDLALERRELIKDTVPNGVDFDEEIFGETKITRIEIKSKEGTKALSKPEGKYITIEFKMKNISLPENEEEIEIVAKEIAALIPKKEGDILIVGLGNHNITPDAIGPKTVEKTISTRHISDELNLRSVAAIAPGVMGQTGIETADIIKSVCDSISPACVIAVDALASKSTDRLCKTIQICDSGISPGSGVHNKRAELSEETLGVPVIAIGVPTVVDALTVAADFSADENIKNENLSNLMVTPREIDSLILNISHLLSLSIGRALHPSLSVSDLYFLSL